jgi:hypothetical protein
LQLHEVAAFHGRAVAGQQAAHAVDEGQHFGAATQTDAHAALVALQGEAVALQQHQLGLGGEGAHFQPVGRGVAHFAGAHQGFVEQGQMARFHERGGATGVPGQAAHELRHIKAGGRGRQREHEADQACEDEQQRAQPVGHLSCQKSKKLNQL